MHIKQYKIKFFTPDFEIRDNFFGCASLALINNSGKMIEKEGAVDFSQSIQGVNIFGSYETVLRDVEKLQSRVDIGAGIILLGNAGGENDFLKRLSQQVKAPIVGGGAAKNTTTGEAGLLHERGVQVSLLLLTDDRFRFEVQSKNIHSHILSEHELSFKDRRVLNQIDGEDAVKWLIEKKKQYGISPEDFERLTFSTVSGINAHLSYSEGVIKSGRDLNQKMQLRLTSNNIDDVMQEFYDDELSIVFGCAGLKGLLEKPFTAKSLGLFMFGEVCFVDNKPDFGNLMLSKIKLTKKNEY